MDTEREWIEIYSYLLTQLRSRELGSVVLEVEHAATARVEDDDISYEIEYGLSQRQVTRELDQSKLRALTPREAFSAAVQVLIIRLREFPAISQKLTEKFNCSTSSIQWRPDASENEFISEQEYFNLNIFSLLPQESSEINAALQHIEGLLNLNSDRNGDSE